MGIEAIFRQFRRTPYEQAAYIQDLRDANTGFADSEPIPPPDSVPPPLPAAVGRIEARLSEIEARKVDIAGELATLDARYGEISLAFDMGNEAVAGDLDALTSERRNLRGEVVALDGEAEDLAGRLTAVKVEVRRLEHESDLERYAVMLADFPALQAEFRATAVAFVEAAQVLQQKRIAAEILHRRLDDYGRFASLELPAAVPVEAWGLGWHDSWLTFSGGLEQARAAMNA